MLTLLLALSLTAPARDLEVVAHRGVHQRWIPGTYDRMTGCEAAHALPPTHGFIENTLPAIGAAFDHGATLVEIDVRATADGRLVVHHDGDLSCKTDGQGPVRAHTLAELRGLDLGHGYTADGGATYPLRGTGRGLMVTLEEVLDAFPGRRFLVDHKDGDPESARLLVDLLAARTPQDRARVSYWGPDPTYAWIAAHSDLRRYFYTRDQMKRWLVRRLLTLGVAGFGEGTDGQALGLPVRYRRAVPGWRHALPRRAERRGRSLLLFVDDPADLRFVARSDVQGVVTDRIEVIGPALRQMGIYEE